MKIRPFQDLFIQQELALGSSQNNVLHGRAEMSGIDFNKFCNSVHDLLKISQWAYLSIDLENFKWVFGETLNGILSVGESVSKNEINLDHYLWCVSIYQANSKIILELSMHHALADAHSFQLFWADLKSVYKGEIPKSNKLVTIKDPPNSFNFTLKNNIPKNTNGPVERYTVNISKNRKTRAENIAKKKGIFLSTFILGGLQNTLTSLNHYFDFPLQTGLALRNRSGKKERLNFLTSVNFLPVPHYPLEKIKLLNNHIKLLFRNQSYPLLEWLKNNQQSTAFNVLFSYQKEKYYDADIFDLTEITFLPNKTDENILSVHVLEYGSEEIKISFDYRTDFADRVFWRKFIVEYLNFTWSLITKETNVLNFPKSILKNRNIKTTSLWKNFKNVPDNKIAIISRNKKQTFGDLKQKLASFEKIEPNQLLYIKPERSLQNILDILKAWENNCSVTFSFTNEMKNPVEDCLYMALTSGSTGISKRCFISKKGIETMLNDWKNKFHIDSESVHLTTADQQFDVFFGDIFRSIFLGNTLVIADVNERLEPSSICSLIKKFKVTHYESTPTLLNLLLPQLPIKSSLKTLICGSEPMSNTFYNYLLNFSKNGVKIFNSYGLTEVSIDSAACEINKYLDNMFPVGFPIGDQIFTIANLNGITLPLGMFGELLISGSCVAFLENNENIFFRTGDLAMIHPDKGLIVKGRIDDTFIKVNGKRIPSKAIENQILLNTDASNCFVFEKKGFAVLLHNSSFNHNNIEDLLTSIFPKYQIPELIIQNHVWPINKNGKLDKLKIKKDFILSSQETNIRWVPLNNPQEMKIHEISSNMGKFISSKNNSLLFDGWNSVDLLSFCNEFLLNGYVVNTQQFLRTPTINNLLKQINYNAPTNLNQNTGEIDIDDDTLSDLLDTLNK